MNRCVLFGFLTIFSGTACLSTYYVQTFEQLLVCRTLTGIGIGAASPITFSLMGDYFSQENRIHVSTFLGVMMTIGISFGQLLSGLVGPKYGWRMPFLLVALPCIFFAFLVLVTCTEPERGDQERAMRAHRVSSGAERERSALSAPLSVLPSALPYQAADQMERYESGERKKEVRLVDRNSITNPIIGDRSECEHDGGGRVYTSGGGEGEGVESVGVPEDMGKNNFVYSETITWDKIKRLVMTPSVALILLQGVPGCVPWGIFFVYLNDYLSENKGFSVEQATVIVTMFGVGGLFGQWLGGWAGQRLYNLDKRYQIYLMGCTTILATGPLLVLVNTDSHPGTYPFLIVVGFLSGVLVLINGPNINVVLQNVCTPETRGTGFAFFTLTNDVGRGGGPLIVAYMVSLLGGRENAYNVAFFGLVLCGLIILTISYTVEHDEAAVQLRVRAAIVRGFQSVGTDDCADDDDDDDDDNNNNDDTGGDKGTGTALDTARAAGGV